ncbi:IcmT/TraK family protein [Erwinia sp. STN24]|jgi:intracellular multiplication protein IcmT|uniref:IcmT/TraK family protein n=1 Tax=Erwinia sp. STN24 TaxID=3233996 RepID=UPI003522AB1A
MRKNQWRNVSKPLMLGIIPVMSLFIYLLWFPFPSMDTLYFCTFIVGFYAVLGYFGYTVKVLYQKLLRVLRGKLIRGRPWWYRRNQR